MSCLGRIFCLIAALALCARADADARLASVFGDHMVLQRATKVPVWGFAAPGEAVHIRLGSQQRDGVADADGKWRVVFDALDAKPDPIEMVVQASNTVRVRDILPGEVWLCAGQSNMVWPVRSSLDAAKEIATADFPQIRYFKVGRRALSKPDDEVFGRWVVCSPQTAGDFSGVAYYFGRELHRAIKAPVGLIESSWNGTPAEAWVDRETLRSEPLTQPIIQRYNSALPRLIGEFQQYQKRVSDWREAAYVKDPGDSKSALGWAKPEFQDSSWKTVTLPARLEDALKADVDGAFWFRKEINLPAAWQGKDLSLNLGPIDDDDITWFNGQRVGSTKRDFDGPRRQVHRNYNVPGTAVRAGRNLIAVRVFDLSGAGGLLGPAQDMYLHPRDLSLPEISLAGEWKAQSEMQVPRRVELPPMPGDPGLNSPMQPGNLYNGMIRPLMPLAIKGVAWYHGETNVDRAYQFRGLLASQIRGWRNAWQEGDFPFLIVQLANFHAPAPPEAPQQWAELREAQFTVARSVPKCALVVTTDLGESGDIHPRNKQDVGKRLSLAALRTAYGADVFSNGPIYRSMKVDGKQVTINFEASKCGLVCPSGKLNGFAVAGKDRKFVPADAQIKGNTVVVWNDAVSKPAAVRYAWSDDPHANLYNSEGLPAIPFRTDDWPGVTFEKR
jgi:sialate O-acetylesterase